MKLFGNKHGGRHPEYNGDPAEATWDYPEDENLADYGGDYDGEYDGEYEDAYAEDFDEYGDAYHDAYDAYEDYGEGYDEGYDDEYPEDYDGEYGEDYDGEYDETEEGAGRKKLSTKKKVIIGVLIFLVVLLGAVGLFINYLLNLINYQAANSNYFATVAASELLPEESPINSHLAALDEEENADTLEATPEELEQMNAQIEDITSDGSTYEVPISDDVYNILLLGSDTRVSGDVGRSDAMILVSINQKSQTIYLTSFLRDCYVSIPGYGNTRLNHAFAYGGPALLEQTLENNFKVHVDRYVAVDFFSFMDVIDVLGGVWIDISDEEVEVTNDYIWSMNKLLGDSWDADYLWYSGWRKLNGKQALCYARNRYTGNDYARTQRQRNVISQIISGAMDASPATLVSLAQVILPQVTTDMSKSEVLSYAANAAAYLNYDIQQQQIPYQGTYSGTMINGMSVISLNLDQNIQYLQNTIYAETDYEKIQ